MPHIIVKIVGQSEDSKKLISEALTDTLSKNSHSRIHYVTLRNLPKFV